MARVIRRRLKSEGFANSLPVGGGGLPSPRTSTSKEVLARVGGGGCPAPGSRPPRNGCRLDQLKLVQLVNSPFRLIDPFQNLPLRMVVEKIGGGSEAEYISGIWPTADGTAAGSTMPIGLLQPLAVDGSLPITPLPRNVSKFFKQTKHFFS